MRKTRVTGPCTGSGARGSLVGSVICFLSIACFVGARLAKNHRLPVSLAGSRGKAQPLSPDPKGRRTPSWESTWLSTTPRVLLVNFAAALPGLPDRDNSSNGDGPAGPSSHIVSVSKTDTPQSGRELGPVVIVPHLSPCLAALVVRPHSSQAEPLG